MRRCAHQWQPLILLPAQIPAEKRYTIGFGVLMSHLDRYDRCRLCGRLSHITKSRWRRRKLLSCDTGPIEKRAAELQEWVAKQLKTGPSEAPCTMALHPEPGAPAEAGME